MKHGIPSLVRNGGGAVVLLGSVLGAMGAPGYAAYGASKAALVDLASRPRSSTRPTGRVNVVSPSATDTGLFPRVARSPANPKACGGWWPWARRWAALVGRRGGRHVAFLCSPRGAFISGGVSPSTAPWPPAVSEAGDLNSSDGVMHDIGVAHCFDGWKRWWVRTSGGGGRGRRASPGGRFGLFLLGPVPAVLDDHRSRFGTRSSIPIVIGG